MYQPKDLADYYRPLGNKEESGWIGLAPVIRNVPGDGQVIIRLHSCEYSCRYQDTRHTLLVFHTFLAGLLKDPDTAVDIVIRHIRNMNPRSVKTYGYVYD